jgi:hypothetical protein
MATLDRIRRDLEEQRRGLLAQLAAVESAIAALAAVEPQPQPQPGVVVPTRVKPKRELTDAHKQKLVASSRRAREAKDAAKGLARERHDDSFVPAIGKPGDRQPPRLVKRP